jgi:DNA-binding NarL/FixJ family response regulator
MDEGIRIALVSSLRAVRKGLRSMLAEIEVAGQAAPGHGSVLHIVAEAASLVELVQQDLTLDILLITEEAMVTVSLERLVENEIGAPAILVLSGELQPLQVLQKLSLRSWGVVWLDATSEELYAAIQAVHQGLLVISPGLVQQSVDLPGLWQGRFRPAEGIDRGGAPIVRLTEREKDVLQCLAQGLANKQIAIQLGISEHTVKFHISSLYNKMGVTSRAEAVRYGIQFGLVLL